MTLVLFGCRRSIVETIAAVVRGGALTASILVVSLVVLAWLGPTSVREDASLIRTLRARRGIEVWRSNYLKEGPLLRKSSQVRCGHQWMRPLHLLSCALCFDLLVEALVFWRYFMNCSPLLLENLFISHLPMSTIGCRCASDKWNCIALLVSWPTLPRDYAFLLGRRLRPAAWSNPGTLQPMLGNA